MYSNFKCLCLQFWFRVGNFHSHRRQFRWCHTLAASLLLSEIKARSRRMVHKPTRKIWWMMFLTLGRLRKVCDACTYVSPSVRETRMVGIGLKDRTRPRKELASPRLEDSPLPRCLCPKCQDQSRAPGLAKKCVVVWYASVWESHELQVTRLCGV